MALFRILEEEGPYLFTKDEIDVLNESQYNFPLHETPYSRIAAETGLTENKVIETIAGLRAKGVIRNISGIFSGEKLGYETALVALEVPSVHIDRAAEIINSHPGVSHNYLRDHGLNIWFTLSDESPEFFMRSLDIIKRKSGARRSLVFKNEKMYKLGVMLPAGGKVSRAERASEKKMSVREQSGGDFEITPRGRETVLFFQMDLPALERPFRENLLKSGIEREESEIIEAGIELIEKRLMRRYAAVLSHRKAGYVYNAMTAWRPEHGIDAAAEIFGREAMVSHLYRRTVYPGEWEYPLFAMIHAQSRFALDSIIRSLSEAAGISDYAVLESLREFKKQRVRYFSPDITLWRRNND